MRFSLIPRCLNLPLSIRRGGGDLAHEGRYELRDDLRASRYDVFGTANFFNFVPWIAALEVLDQVGIEAIAAHDQWLVDLIVSGLDRSGRLRVLSPLSGPARSTIVVVSHVDPEMNPRLQTLLREAGIDVALRSGNLRLSPHLHNDEEDIQRVITALSRHA